MTAFGDTLQKLRIARGLSRKQLAGLAQVDPSYIALLELGKRHQVSFSLARKFATVLGVPLATLVEGDAEVVQRPIQAIIAEFQQSVERMELVEVPVRGAVPAGYLEVREEEVEGYVTIPKAELGSASNVYVLRVAGDSLQGDGIMDGDLVIVDPEPEVMNGKLYIVSCQNETVARHIHREGDGYKLVTQTPGYDPIYCDEIDIQGRVILSGRWRKH